MKQMRLWAAATVMAIVIIGVCIVSLPHTKNLSTPTASRAEASSTEPVVTLQDVYRKGVHTLSGTLQAPDACTFATASATLIGATSSSQSIVLAISMPADVGVCLQLPQPTAFSTTLSAPQGLPIAVTVNGATASTSAP